MKGLIYFAFGMVVLSYCLFLNLQAAQVLKRAESLNKRSQVLEQEIGKLDRRIKKQEGFGHGFGH